MPAPSFDFETRIGNLLISIAREIRRLSTQEQELRATKERWAETKANALQHARGRLVRLVERQSRVAMHLFDTVDPKVIAEYNYEQYDEKGSDIEAPGSDSSSGRCEAVD